MKHPVPNDIPDAEAAVLLMKNMGAVLRKVNPATAAALPGEGISKEDFEYFMKHHYTDNPITNLGPLTPTVEVADNILKIGGVVYKLKETGGAIMPDTEKGAFWLTTPHGLYFATPIEQKPEAVVEEKPKRDWEILSLRHKNAHHFVIRRKPDGLYTYNEKNHEGGFSLENVLKSIENTLEPIEIFSVKRLSDGAVFTIGDRYSAQHLITGFNYNPHHDQIQIKYGTLEKGGSVDLSYHSPKPKPDYTITAFKSETGEMFVLDNGTYRSEYAKDVDTDSWWPNRTLEWMLENATKCHIYSVRNKAGLEITVGKRYDHQLWQAAVVQKLWKYPEGDTIYATIGKKTTTESLSYPIDSLYAVPVLFTTEDGIEIYGGMPYYVVTKHWAVEKIDEGKPDRELADGSWIEAFSTKEKADAYVFLYKPSLSLAQVHEALFANSGIDEATSEYLSKAYDKLKAWINDHYRSTSEESR